MLISNSQCQVVDCLLTSRIFVYNNRFKQKITFFLKINHTKTKKSVKIKAYSYFYFKLFAIDNKIKNTSNNRSVFYFVIYEVE